MRMAVGGGPGIAFLAPWLLEVGPGTAFWVTTWRQVRPGTASEAPWQEKCIGMVGAAPASSEASDGNIV